MAGRTETSIIWRRRKILLTGMRTGQRRQRTSPAATTELSSTRLSDQMAERDQKYRKRSRAGKKEQLKTAENRNGLEGFRSVSSVEAFRPLDQFSADMSYKDEANLNLSDDGENMTNPGTNQSQLTQCKCNVSFIFMILRK